MTRRYSDVEELTAAHEVSEFDCGSGAQSEWLRDHALQAHRRGTSRVYVVCRVEDDRVVGFHALATGLDDIMDFVEAAADIFVLHQIGQPTATAIEQARILVRITQEVAAGVHGLRKFKGLEKHWVEINEIENEGDTIHRRAVAELFSGDHKALEVLTWKELYEQAEEAIDACEKVANILEAIVLKQ